MGFLLPSSSWLLKLPIRELKQYHFEKGGEKKKRNYQRGIRIWSPIQELTPPSFGQLLKIFGETFEGYRSNLCKSLQGLTLLSGQNIFDLENNIFQVQWLTAILIKIRI